MLLLVISLVYISTTLALSSPSVPLSMRLRCLIIGNPNSPKLIVFIDRDLGLCLHTLHLSPLKKVKQILYFLKPSNTAIVLNKDNIEHYIQFGTVIHSPLYSNSARRTG
jgi:hypothetical protein